MKYCSNCGDFLSDKLPVICQKCGSQYWLNPRCCAAALTMKDNKLLMVRRASEPWKGFWDIPGGYCEAYEHPETSAIRETLEETGINILIESYYGIWLDAVDHPNYGHNICVYYLAKPLGDDVGKPDGKETDKVEWFDMNNLPEKIAFPKHIPKVISKMLDDNIINRV